MMTGEEGEQIEEAEAMYHVVVAEVLRELGYQDRAEESYMKAVSIDPCNSQIRVRYSAFLAHTGRIGAALAELEDVLAAEPGNAFARLNYGLALEQSGDFSRAAAAVTECLKAEPASSELWCTLGRLLERDGRAVEAVGCYRESIAFNGENPRPHYDLGNLLLRLGEPEAAETGIARSGAARPAGPGRGLQLRRRPRAERFPGRPGRSPSPAGRRRAGGRHGPFPLRHPAGEARPPGPGRRSIRGRRRARPGAQGRMPRPRRAVAAQGQLLRPDRTPGHESPAAAWARTRSTTSSAMPTTPRTCKTPTSITSSSTDFTDVFRGLTGFIESIPECMKSTKWHYWIGTVS